MKEIIQIEITRPSKSPTVFVEEPASLPEGATIELHIMDGMWEGAVFVGKILPPHSIA